MPDESELLQKCQWVELTPFEALMIGYCPQAIDKGHVNGMAKRQDCDITRNHSSGKRIRFDRQWRILLHHEP